MSTVDEIRLNPRWISETEEEMRQLTVQQGICISNINDYKRAIKCLEAAGVEETK